LARAKQPDVGEKMPQCGTKLLNSRMVGQAEVTQRSPSLSIGEKSPLHSLTQSWSRAGRESASKNVQNCQAFSPQAVPFAGENFDFMTAR
jgi:hypothetical protein